MSDLLARLAAFDSATLANALEAIEGREPTEGYASYELRCQFPELPPIVGTAVTCTHDSTTADQPVRSRLAELIDVLAETPGPTVVVCQYVGEDRERGCVIGDLFALLLRRLGAVGVVTDTGVRDLHAIAERVPGFQVFSPGSVAAHGRPTFIEVGMPVDVGGLHVEPGQLVHADANGVLGFPAALAEPALENAGKVVAAERALVELLNAEPFSLDDVRRAFLGRGYR